MANSQTKEFDARRFRASLRREAQAINERNRVPGDPHYKAPSADLKWCRAHEGMHSRRADCVDFGYQVEMVACDAHGKKPHIKTDACVNTRKADPFYGF